MKDKKIYDKYEIQKIISDFDNQKIKEAKIVTTELIIVTLKNNPIVKICSDESFAIQNDTEDHIFNLYFRNIKFIIIDEESEYASIFISFDAGTSVTLIYKNL